MMSFVKRILNIIFILLVTTGCSKSRVSNNYYSLEELPASLNNPVKFIVCDNKLIKCSKLTTIGKKACSEALSSTLKIERSKYAKSESNNTNRIKNNPNKKVPRFPKVGKSTSVESDSNVGKRNTANRTSCKCVCSNR